MSLRKTKLSITVDEELLKWLDTQIKKKRFANRSHGFEFAMSHLPGEWSKYGFIQQGLEDTLSDILSDLIGGILAFSLFKTTRKNYNDKQ